MNTIAGHYSAKYDAELSQLGDTTLEMAQLVEKQLRRAVQSFVQGDQLLAQQVAEDEEEINNFEVRIDRDCVEILARRHPIASDLRFIIMIIKTVNDLERMGDEVHRVSQMGSRAVASSGDRLDSEDIEKLGARLHKLMVQTLEVLRDTDDVRALGLIRKRKKLIRGFSQL